MKKKGNMELWNSWSKTNPDDTKPVRFGARKFTAIDPYSQIRKMTETFGPLGSGWSYEAHLEEGMLQVGLVCYRIELRVTGHTHPENKAVVHVGSARLNNKNGVDDDAPKKAITDGLTKCFSMLGMNADVFEGKFDDNKYVIERRKEEAWDAERSAFCAEIENLGFVYDDVAAWCEMKGNPRPSNMTAHQREQLLNHLATPEGREAINATATGD